MDILIRHDYSPGEIKKSELKRDEFRKNRFTSGVANLDNMIALGKAVILCPDHSRKFNPRLARYRAHPDKKLRRVIGNCDVCQQLGLSHLFLNEKDADEEQKKLEGFLRAIEYGRLAR